MDRAFSALIRSDFFSEDFSSVVFCSAGFVSAGWVWAAGRSSSRSLREFRISPSRLMWYSYSQPS